MRRLAIVLRPKELTRRRKTESTTKNATPRSRHRRKKRRQMVYRESSKVQQEKEPEHLLREVHIEIRVVRFGVLQLDRSGRDRQVCQLQRSRKPPGLREREHGENIQIRMNSAVTVEVTSGTL